MSKHPTSTKPGSTAAKQGPDRRSDTADGSTDYGFYHSGRRAAGHGGGSLDARPDGADPASRPAGDASTGGRGHTPQRSLQHETDEELEGRTGPYVRSGAPDRQK
ncbi:MAG TPA: hypothetical protein VEA17_17005 [Bordetella sp.]|nr:hypothetical protein [Bordetella sp.]